MTSNQRHGVLTRGARNMFSLTFASGLLTLATGCTLEKTAWNADPWINGYQSAETQADELDTGMVICYRDTAPNRPDEMLEASRSAVANDSKSGYVRCALTKSYAWDRKYVAQFGVDRSPALIVLHPDGTYHAHVGLLTEEGVQAFLASANPPGNAPNLNAFLHREPRYTWQPSTEAAEAAAKESNRSMLIVFHRPWSDDFQRLNRMLSNPAVYRRFSKMVHLRSGAAWSFSDVAETKYGTLKLPAIVIVRPDQTYRILEGPSGYEDVVRFADKTEPNNEAQASTPPTTVLGSK